MVLKDYKKFNDTVLKFRKCHQQFREVSVGKVPLGGSANLGKCQSEDFNLSDFLGIIFILIQYYLMNATNKYFF